MDLKHHDVKYKRWIYLTVTFVIILAGLASRKYGNALPKFIAEYIGDTLWAAMVYWGLRFLFPSASILKVTAISLLFSYCIEISQLYQVDWANAIRNTTLGALVFGHGFLWSDMICYTVGVMLSATVDSCASFLLRMKQYKTRRGQRNTDSMQAAIIPAKSIRRTHFTRLHLLLRMATPFLCDGIAICKRV